jgi:Fe-S-cluster containining protein
MTLGERVTRSFDKHWGKAVQEQGLKFSCSAGCFHCCKEPAYVSNFEAREVVRHIRSENMPEVILSTKEWAQKFESRPDLTAEREPHVTPWRSADLWCPLLKDGKCSVYAHRPIACRGHCALGPAELCASDATRTQQTFAMAPQVIQRATIPLLEHYDELEFNHLGCFLSEMLLGKKINTAAEFKPCRDTPETGRGEEIEASSTEATSLTPTLLPS